MHDLAPLYWPNQDTPRRVPIHDALTARIAQLEDQLEQERNENRDLRELTRGLQNVNEVNSRIITHLRTKLDGLRRAA
jgi:hypothetical protein